MPAALDLAGRRFGQLLVLSRGPKVQWGRVAWSWLCRCNCGAELYVPQNRLPHRATIPAGHILDSCEDCRAIPCEICGVPVPRAACSPVCSPACRAEKQRAYQLAYYHNKRTADPDDTARRQERARDRYARLPPDERHAANQRRYQKVVATHGREPLNSAARQQHAQRMRDPEYAARHSKKTADWARSNRDKWLELQRNTARKRRRNKAATEIRDILNRGDGNDD